MVSQRLHVLLVRQFELIKWQLLHGGYTIGQGWGSCFKGTTLPSTKSGPANLTSSTARTISVRTAIMWFAPPRPHSKRIRHTRVHEGVDAVRLAGSLIRACHQGISFALLDEVKEGLTGKLLFDGLCLTGLISRTCAGNQSAKSHSNSEGFHWLPYV
jgi:hypothetical protein